MAILDHILPWRAPRWPSILSGYGTVPDPGGEMRLPPRYEQELIPGDDYPLSTSPVQEIPLYSFSGWRQHHVQAALDDFEVGALLIPHQMWVAMLRDPVISHGVEGRVTAHVDAKHEWRKPVDLPQALFDEWCARWPDVFDENEMASAVRLRIGLGVAPAQVLWTVGEQAYWPRRIRVLDSGNLTWFPTERRFKLVTFDQGQLTVEDDCDPFMLFQERAASYSYLHAAARALAVHWWLKSEAERLEAVYGRHCGNPIKKVIGPVEQRAPTDGRADFQHLVKRAAHMLGGGVFEALKFPPDWQKGFDIDFLEAKGEAHKVFDVITERCDQYFTLKLLGAIDNTQGGRDGSRARAQVHERQSNKYLGADCKLTERTLWRVARKWCQLNRWPPSWAPIPFFEVDPPEDQQQLADVRSKYGATMVALCDKLPALQKELQAQHPGARIDIRQLLLDHQMPLQEPDEAELSALAAAGKGGGAEEQPDPAAPSPPCGPPL